MVKADTIPIPLETLCKVLKALDILDDSRFSGVPAEIHVRDVVDIIQSLEPTFNQVVEELRDCVHHVTTSRLAQRSSVEEIISQDRVNDQSIKQEEQ